MQRVVDLGKIGRGITLDAAAAKAVELGGKAPEPGMDIPGVGRFAVIVDPQGASICPYKPLTWQGEGYDGPGRPGTFVWHELMTPDPEGEGRFYSQIFGWNVVGSKPKDIPNVGRFAVAGDPTGGLFALFKGAS